MSFFLHPRERGYEHVILITLSEQECMGGPQVRMLCKLHGPGSPQPKGAVFMEHDVTAAGCRACIVGPWDVSGLLLRCPTSPRSTATT